MGLEWRVGFDWKEEAHPPTAPAKTKGREASSPLPENWPPLLSSTRQIYFSVDAGHWCASIALS
jgi:hypothetical protein